MENPPRRTANDDPLTGRRVLVLISGSIAAVKLPALVSALVQRGAQVRCVLTPSAAALVSPVALASLSRPLPSRRRPVEPSGPRPLHIELAEWAELVLLAPLSATSLGRWVHGLATPWWPASCWPPRPLSWPPRHEQFHVGGPAGAEQLAAVAQLGSGCFPWLPAVDCWPATGRCGPDGGTGAPVAGPRIPRRLGLAPRLAGPPPPGHAPAPPANPSIPPAASPTAAGLDGGAAGPGRPAAGRRGAPGSRAPHRSCRAAGRPLLPPDRDRRRAGGGVGPGAARGGCHRHGRRRG
jgi:hypothetical protein